MSKVSKAIMSLVSVPWDAFVGAFLYYALITLVVLGGADLSSPVMAAAYLAVPVAYAALLAGRMLRALGHAATPIVAAPQLH